ncbi:MFS transporter, partial [Bacillus sp. 5001]
MTATFIIIYIVVALILIGFINFFLIKRKRKNKDKRVEQRSTIDSKRESNQSKFKASDLEQTTKSNTDPTQSNDIEDEKRKNHFDSEIDNASQSINTDSKEDR